jgi:hypothetical protein
MTPLPPTSRRAVLGAGVCLGAAAVLSGAATAAPGLAARLVDTLDRPSSAAALGRVVLEEAPEATVRRLVAELATSMGRSADDLVELDRDALRAALRAAREADFRAMRIVRVRGWILAATEARLCALAALA